MVEKLIIEDDQFRLFLIPATPHEDWINFRVRSVAKHGKRNLRSRLAYNRVERRLSRNKATQAFQERDEEALNGVVALLESAIRQGLV